MYGSTSIWSDFVTTKSVALFSLSKMVFVGPSESFAVILLVQRVFFLLLRQMGFGGQRPVLEDDFFDHFFPSAERDRRSPPP